MEKRGQLDVPVGRSDQEQRQSFELVGAVRRLLRFPSSFVFSLLSCLFFVSRKVPQDFQTHVGNNLRTNIVRTKEQNLGPTVLWYPFTLPPGAFVSPGLPAFPSGFLAP